ncbi:GNAT family N-acetyltransferase [Sphingomonas bacterium]|uniref:GNAT family N-acetyltransferase n=1 Tax=Sphingomonas bacterium TaxID=1895847 RepID=UPI001575757B|nr:GNAT family N-acetyltransferase [Sphingomonas bacterium]
MIYRDVALADGPALAAMACVSFTETFGHLYTARDLATFLDRTFGPGGLPAQIGDPAYRIRLAVEGAAIAGFAKIGPVAFPGDWPERAIELHQLYVLSGHQGTGVGPTLMDWATDAARERGSSDMVLSVWVENDRARAFYERRGFVEVGRYVFRVGDHEDDDRLMRLTL